MVFGTLIHLPIVIGEISIRLPIRTAIELYAGGPNNLARLRPTLTFVSLLRWLLVSYSCYML